MFKSKRHFICTVLFGCFHFGFTAMYLPRHASAQPASEKAAALAAPSMHRRIQDRMREFVDAGEIAGAVTLVASREGTLDLTTVGHQDIESKSPMTDRTVFWIASMTKPITGVAVLMLEEQGKLSLEDLVSKYVPEFEQLKDSQGKSAAITLKHLLTHTAGLSELTSDESAPLRGLDELTNLVVKKPLQFVPGSQWKYSQTAINSAARVVEVVSGEKFDEYLNKRLFQPLKMTDTAFYLSKEQELRLAKSYRREADGELKLDQVRILYGKPATSIDRMPLANGGLFSTAPDYARFCRMLLGGGTLESARILRPETVRRFSEIHSGDLKTGFTPGNGWGVGCCVVREPQGVTAELSAGSFGHGGAYGTQAWIDPVRDRIYILMVQRSNFTNSDASPVRVALQKAAQ